MQQNTDCKLCGEKNQMVNHLIRWCSNLAQKEQETRQDWAGKVIPWELCKRLKLDHTTKSLFENKTYKILWDSEIQVDHLILVRPSAN